MAAVLTITAAFSLRLRAAVATGTLLSLTSIPVAAEENVDLTQLSIEQLLSVEVYSASKFVQKTTEAPSAVTVITSADISSYGYRTLADILNSVRGMNVTYDRNYQYLGIRGFNRPGDYNSRVLLLVDGYRVNDANFDTASIGGEFFLDVDLIKRVEVVRGPGSSIYGSNAFFLRQQRLLRRSQRHHQARPGLWRFGGFGGNGQLRRRRGASNLMESRW